VRDTRRDLAACFGWKQVGLGFPSLASRLAEARRWVVHVAPSRRLRQNKAEDGRVDATGCIGCDGLHRTLLPYFIIFIVLVTKDIVIFWSFA
jgi:hypothetical protein